MKYLTLIIVFILQIQLINAQIIDEIELNNRSGKNVHIGGIDSLWTPNYYINGKLTDENSIFKIHPNKVGTIFVEYIDYERDLENASAQVLLDIEFLKSYIGAQLKHGLYFLFTKQRTKKISLEKLEQYINRKSSNNLFKIGYNQPLSSSFVLPQNCEVVEIHMIENFKLAKWDTGKVDKFTLFVIQIENYESWSP